MIQNNDLNVAAPSQVDAMESANKNRSKILMFLQKNWLFFATFFLPVTFSLIYFGVIVSDIYVSESVFVVRGNQKQSSSGAGLSALVGAGGGGAAGIGGSGGFSRSFEDIDSVKNYILSRDALELLIGQLDIKKHYETKNIDIFSRFNGFGIDNSFEEFFEYYKKYILITADPLSSCSTLTVKAFSAEEAQKINKLLLNMAEELVNKINERSRNDLIKFSQNEVDIANNAAKKAALAVSDFRNKETVVDPEKQTEIHFAQLSKLQDLLITTKAQLVQIEKFAPDSPHPPALKLRIELLEKEMANETALITGGKDSLASKASEYERLQLESDFQQKQLALALSSLESARNQAQRQTIYLETIAKPNLPDEAILPKRFIGVLATLVVSFVIWGILSMLISGIQEHKG
jgi:capsular polysaccharide transport system permease protein